jgi:hypothetical protein
MTTMRKYLKYGLLALGALWLLALTAIMTPKFIAVRAETHAAERVFNSFTQNIIEGQYEKAYELCGPDFRSELSIAQFADQQKLLTSKYGRLLKVKRQGMKVSESGEPEFWNAEFSGDLQYEKAARRFEFAFRKQFDHWVVFGYREMGPAGSR